MAVRFDKLTLKSREAVQRARLQAQLAEAELRLRIDDAAKQRLVDEGFDPTYGAWPLKRVIRQWLANA